MERHKLQKLGILAAAVAALLLLAAGLHNITLAPGRPFRLETPRPFGGGAGGGVGTGEVPGWISGVFIAMLVFVVIAILVSPALRRDLLRNLPLYILWIIGIYLLTSNLQNMAQPALPVEVAEPPGGVPVEGEPTAIEPIVAPQPPEWLVFAVSLLIVAVIGVALWLIWRRMQRTKKRDPLTLIVDEARDALADLRSGGDLRDTIMRCYAEMVRVLSQERGIVRDATMTPREFEQRLLSAGLRDEHIRRLTRLFEMVRYSPRQPGEREEREAETCLESIVNTYHTPKEAPARQFTT